MRIPLKKQSSQQEGQQWRRAIELMVVGICVGVAVILVRAFTPAGSQLQWGAMLLAAVLLTSVHFALRQTARRISASQSPDTPRPSRPQRPDPAEVFAKELDRRWTGLADPTLPPEQRERYGDDRV